MNYILGHSRRRGLRQFCIRHGINLDLPEEQRLELWHKYHEEHRRGPFMSESEVLEELRKMNGQTERLKEGLE